MTSRDDRPEKGAELRRRAEEVAREKATGQADLTGQ
jgi:hypothetical protein